MLICIADYFGRILYRVYSTQYSFLVIILIKVLTNSSVQLVQSFPVAKLLMASCLRLCLLHFYNTVTDGMLLPIY